MLNLFFSQAEPKFHPPQIDNHILETQYQELVDKQLIQSDIVQLKVLVHLQQLLNELSKPQDLEKFLAFNRSNSTSRQSAKSVYIFGDVGRGKSMLMDMFFDACPMQSKRRIHFHAFMLEVHEYMYQWRKRNQGDPLPSLASKMRKTSSLLCVDEFQVTDIADAMLLARLFTILFEQGIILVATSNQHPDDLYEKGLQRELFLPFIDLLKQSADILKLDATEDYRLLHLKVMKTTFYSEPDGKDTFLQQSFKELINGGISEAITLQIKGREVSFETVHGDVLFSSFDELCKRALGAADYLTIANEFHTVLIANIPRLTAEIRDQVRRFVTLIDALYEHNVKLICTAVVPAEELTFKDRHFDFKRTRSRLIEMQSEKYFQLEHLG